MAAQAEAHPEQVGGNPDARGSRSNRREQEPQGNKVSAERITRMSPADQRMTKGEREDLQRLIRQREKVLKSAARERSAQLVAEFENQLGSQYAFDQDEVWAEAKRLA